MQPKRVLVIEDDAPIRQGITDALRFHGYQALEADGGPDSLERALRGDYDLLLLDLVLPARDGLEILGEVQKALPTLPVIILTARGEEADRVRGLRLGADDYVTKPFGLLELMARVAALLRRAGVSGDSTAAPEPERFGDIEVDSSTRTVRRRGEPVALTPMEFDLLVALLRRGGTIASRVELLKEVWGHSAAVVTRTVDTHVAELRRKIEDNPAKPRHILTVRKIGYRLER